MEASWETRNCSWTLWIILTQRQGCSRCGWGFPARMGTSAVEPLPSPASGDAAGAKGSWELSQLTPELWRPGAATVGGPGGAWPSPLSAKWGNHSFPSSRFLKEWFCPRSHIIHISHLAVSSRQAGPAQCPKSSSPAPNLELALPRSLCFYQSGVKRVRLMLCSTKICTFGLAWTIHSFWVRGQKNGFLKI